MKYLCLVYGEEALMRTVDDAECVVCSDSMERSGQRVAAEALQPVRTARTIRVREGRAEVSDGPFAETKEQLAGFYLIDAEDLSDALEIARTIPAARIGSVEVRPVRELRPGTPR
jgi:hypothetical protein